MASGRSVSLDLPLATVLTEPKREWGLMANGGNRVRVARNIEVDWGQFGQDNYLFSHCTIVASVATEDNGYHIKPACADLVNNNGNGWTNPVLMSSFRSFVGGENYLEHIQIPELSKGKILDAVLRPVTYKADGGDEVEVYYCDILVATDRRHEGLVRNIEAGKMGTMSMGCVANYVQCSQCGVVLGDNDPNCEHIERNLLRTFVGDDGVERVVAELCGRSFLKDGKLEGDPDSVKFIEASWVENPAFAGAVLNHSISDISKAAAKILEFPTHRLEATVEDLFRMRVADRAGMITLRIARDELMRRRFEAISDKVARGSF
jgi:hypothetical protein